MPIVTWTPAINSSTSQWFYASTPFTVTTQWTAATTSTQVWSYQSAAANSVTANQYLLQGNNWNNRIVSYPQTQAAPAVISEETRRRMEAEQRAYDERLRRATREQKAKEEETRKRARALLMQSLTRDQQRSLDERAYFDLNIGGKHYRIRQGTHGNVRLVQGDREVTSYCAQPDNVPAEDAMLAQKLMLETDEAAFLRVANARQLAA